jgi:hypothetical protein
MVGPFYIMAVLQNNGLKYKGLLRVLFAGADSLQLFRNLLYEPFSNGTRRYIVSVRREGD